MLCRLYHSVNHSSCREKPPQPQRLQDVSSRISFTKLVYSHITSLMPLPKHLVQLLPRDTLETCSHALETTPAQQHHSSPPPRRFVCLKATCHFIDSVDRDLIKKKDRLWIIFDKKTKTYNTPHSLVVTDPTTTGALTCLTRAERTGCRVFKWIWSYVTDLLRNRNKKVGKTEDRERGNEPTRSSKNAEDFPGTPYMILAKSEPPATEPRCRRIKPFC